MGEWSYVDWAVMAVIGAWLAACAAGVVGVVLGLVAHYVGMIETALAGRRRR